jgi:hypothetical protein
MAGRYPVDRARVYEQLEDALAALDVARSAVHSALAAASYPHIREDDMTEQKKATPAVTNVA